ncbi:MAG: hypothetical protein AB8G23_16985 [Myxococcota bacterium]
MNRTGSTGGPEAAGEPGVVPAAHAGPEPEYAETNAPTHFSTFYIFYVGLFALVFAYLISVRVTEAALQVEFQDRAERAIVVSDFDTPIVMQMKDRIDEAVRESDWVRLGGLRVNVLVLARDGVTWLYVDGHGTPLTGERIAPSEVLGEWMDYLPASARATVTLPHNALISNVILILYASLLLLVVYFSNRKATGQEVDRLNAALESRNASAQRAQEIEEELLAARSALSEIEPLDQAQSLEIESLQSERQILERHLSELASREERLRSGAERAVTLAGEVRALEDLLEEASGDLAERDSAIGQLEQSLEQAEKRSGKVKNAKSKAKAKSAELISRRFKTLYKTIEIDDRAIEDIAGLGDESLRLKAEESIKRLADEADNVAVRRKVNGLPSHVLAFELGFAGKGRIYYTRGQVRRFRVLLVGAKNTQDADLDYISRLPRETFG